MEALSPLSSRHSSRSSRRSFPNLTHLSLAPLSSHFPIDDDGYDEHADVQLPPKSSYIQGKSAPSTPCILASNSKPPRPRIKKQSYAHESYFPPVQDAAPRAPLTKAKSANAISVPRRQDAATPLHGHALSPPRIRGDDEWLHRAGVVIAAETREYKGQGWLASRESSTSLVRAGEADDDYDGAIDEGRASQRTSRPGSRVASARPSRRGSRAGSKADFATLTAVRAHAPREATEELLAEDAALAMEPDFVLKDDRWRGGGDDDGDDEGEEEAEVERLARARGSGLGGLVGHLVGWPLFDVDEDSEDDPAAGGDAADNDEGADAEARRLARVRRRREALARAAEGSASATASVVVVEPPRMEDEGGWNDVTWLLSVASKVIL
jgi:hypothetical protein